MPTLKYSKQRECIKNFLAGRKDHPTADVIYLNLREQFPHISLGTVYRNLALLSELGEINKLTTGDGADHFDGDVSPHQHFICRQCGQIIDLKVDSEAYIQKAVSGFKGDIESCISYFYGVCEECLAGNERFFQKGLDDQKKMC